jgi:hypothetical protein
MTTTNRISPDELRRRARHQRWLAAEVRSMFPGRSGRAAARDFLAGARDLDRQAAELEHHDEDVA